MKKIALFWGLYSVILLCIAEPSIIPPQKAIVCASCHGPLGITQGSAMQAYPDLAGQHAAYLTKQLLDYKSHKRDNAIMMSFATSLTERDIQNIATFYAAQKPAEGQTPQKYLKRGEQLYRGGDFDKHITACIACHGPRGTGNAEAGFPALSGQHPQYTVQQLQLFKENKRNNDLNSIMRDISARMDTEDIQAVAYYIAGLH